MIDPNKFTLMVLNSDTNYAELHIDYKDYCLIGILSDGLHRYTLDGQLGDDLHLDYRGRIGVLRKPNYLYVQNYSVELLNGQIVTYQNLEFRLVEYDDAVYLVLESETSYYTLLRIGKNGLALSDGVPNIIHFDHGAWPKIRIWR